MIQHGRARSRCLVVCSHFHERVGDVSVARESGILHEVVHHAWKVLGGQVGRGSRGISFLHLVCLLVVFLSEG